MSMDKPTPGGLVESVSDSIRTDLEDLQLIANTAAEAAATRFQGYLEQQALATLAAGAPRDIPDWFMFLPEPKASDLKARFTPLGVWMFRDLEANGRAADFYRSYRVSDLNQQLPPRPDGGPWRDEEFQTAIDEQPAMQSAMRELRRMYENHTRERALQWPAHWACRVHARIVVNQAVPILRGIREADAQQTTATKHQDEPHPPPAPTVGGGAIPADAPLDLGFDGIFA